MMKFVVDNDDPVLHLGLLLHEIVERMTALHFYLHEIDILQVNTIELPIRTVSQFDNFPPYIIYFFPNLLK